MPVKKQKFYQANPNLPDGELEFEFTPEMRDQLLKCREDIFYFAENFFHIVQLDRGKEKIRLYGAQKKVLKVLCKSKRVALLASRQIGKSTVTTIYALWVACFQKDKRIIMLANKEKTAIQLFSRIRLAYEMLPNWLKPGVKDTFGKSEMKLVNGSSIACSSTSASSVRGDSANVLILDELAFVANEIVNEFWESVMPIISSSPNSQIFIVSTPNGTQNKFYDIYTKAERGESDWTAIRVDWWHVPGRTETWKKRMIQDLGSVDRFNQEFGNQFIEVGQSPFKKEVFDFLREGAKGLAPVQAYVDTHGGFEPQDRADEFTTFKIYQAPSKDRVYSIGVDVSDGVGRAASVAIVLDITDLREIHIVAIYHNRRVAPVVFATKLNIIGQLYGTPNMLIERNNVGGQVVDELYNVHHYTRLVNYSPTNDKMKYYDKLGVYSHTNSKYQGVTNMRYWFDELMCVHVPDIATIQEFEIFVRSVQGTWAHQPGEHNFDDRVMATTWGLFILDRKIAEEYLTVIAYDETGRPLKVEDPGSAFNELDFDQQMSKFSMFGRNVNSPMSTYFGSAAQNSVQQEEIGDYLEQGWTFA